MSPSYSCGVSVFKRLHLLLLTHTTPCTSFQLVWGKGFLTPCDILLSRTTIISSFSLSRDKGDEIVFTFELSHITLFKLLSPMQGKTLHMFKFPIATHYTHFELKWGKSTIVFMTSHYLAVSFQLCPWPSGIVGIHFLHWSHFARNAFLCNLIPLWGKHFTLLLCISLARMSKLNTLKVRWGNIFFWQNTTFTIPHDLKLKTITDLG